MKKFIYLLAMSLSLGLVACGDDEEEVVVSPGTSNTQQGNTSQTLPDPEGTVLINMNNGKSQNYSIGIGTIYIDDANNFCCAGNSHYDNYIEFVSLGLAGGLSQIKDIPLTGWAESVAVVPGTAYIAKRSNYSYSWGSYTLIGYSYVRLYVVDYIVGTSGGIIGAIVKYHSPFKGSDEELQLSKQSITLDAFKVFYYEGGYSEKRETGEEITINNQNAIVFSVSSNQDWCKVEVRSQQRIWITCYINSTASSRVADVTLTTAYGKKSVVKVIQKGQNVE